MIKQSTVLMATPIALLATEKGLNLHEMAGDVIKGLDETTAKSGGYTEDNIATELPEYTALVPDHTDVMEAATDIIADKIRSSLQVISKYIKPTLKEVENKLRSELDPANVAETIFGYLQMEMVNIEPAFLNSQYYPSVVPANFANVNAVRLTDLLQGAWPTMTAMDLKELIDVPVTELAPFLANPQAIKDVYDTLFLEKGFWSIFDVRSIKDGVANIMVPENYAFSNFKTLVIGSLIVNKLAQMDDPIDGITGVSLDDYRTSLAVTRDLFNTMLVRFKSIWESKAAAGVVILGNEVQYKVADYGNMNGRETLMGKLSIGYNNAVLEMFADGDHLSLSEFAVGYVYAQKRGIRITDIITDKDKVIDAYTEYCNDVRANLALIKSKLGAKALSLTLEALYANDAYKPVIDTMEQDVHPTQRVLSRISQNFDLELFFSNYSTLDAVVKGENTLMNTTLAPALARAFDCPIAEEILTLNAAAEPGPIEHQRKVLSMSIDTVILNRLVKG